MKERWQRRDVLLFLILIMMVVNFVFNSTAKKLNAETFRVDSCVTSKPADRPDAYLHVVTH